MSTFDMRVASRVAAQMMEQASTFAFQHELYGGCTAYCRDGLHAAVLYAEPGRDLEWWQAHTPWPDAAIVDAREAPEAPAKPWHAEVLEMIGIDIDWSEQAPYLVMVRPSDEGSEQGA